MEEQLISFETAVLAKEKGWNIEYPCFYHKYENNTYKLFDFRMKRILTSEFSDIMHTAKGNYYHCCIAPTQSLLQKWLRDEKSINVYCIPSAFSSRSKDWIFVISRNGYEHIHQTDSIFNTYEESLEKGLALALSLLKDI